MKRLYVDDTELASLAVSTVADDSSVVIGSDREDGTLSTPFVGALDEVRIYDRALAAGEIAALP